MSEKELLPSLLQRLLLNKNQFPDQVALTLLPTGELDHQQIRTYDQLFTNASKLATGLIQHCQPGDRIILMLPFDPDYFAVVWGAWMAGVVVVPIPVAESEAQISFSLRIIKDSGARLIISYQDIYQRLLPALQQQSLSAVLLEPELALSLQPSPLPAPPSGLAPALLQYTSGSTGNPKGVLVTHQNIDASMNLMLTIADLDRNSTLVTWAPLFHNMGFLSFGLLPLCAGAHMVQIPTERFMENPARWLMAISHFKGTHSGSPNIGYETCLNYLPDALLDHLDLSHWRVAAVGAEPLKAPLIHQFSDRFARCGFKATAFITTYGFSEATVYTCASSASDLVTMLDIDKVAFAEGKIIPSTERVKTLVSVGQAGEHIRIVDPDSSAVVSDLMLGEIWVQGDTVAQGYWNNPEATEQTFHHYTSDGQGPFVRSGDLGIMNNGFLYVVGRRKELIIVNGTNLHPLDIEQSVTGLFSAQVPYACAAYAWTVNDTEHLAIFQEIKQPESEQEHQSWIQLINDRVQQQFGVSPARVLLLAPGSLPRTHNGKMQRIGCLKLLTPGAQQDKIWFDWNGLKDSSIAAQQVSDQRLPLLEPCTETESIVADIWCQVFNRPAIDVAADFIGLGGQSILATQIVAQINQRFSLEISLASFFQHASIRQLAQFIDQTPPLEISPDLTVINSSEVLADSIDPFQAMPLTRSQNRLWVLQQLSPFSCAYNMSARYRIQGPLQIQALNDALKLVIKRHRILHSVYRRDEGKTGQQALSDFGFAIQVEQKEGVAEEQISDYLSLVHSRPFLLDTELPIRACLIKTGANDHQLLLTIHHIAADGWSIGILNKELTAAYNSLIQQQPPELKPVPWHYADWAGLWVGLEESKLSAKADAAKDYWLDQLQQLPAQHDLPLDRPRAERSKRLSGFLNSTLSAATLEALSAVCLPLKITQYSLLQTTLAVLMARLSGQADIAIGVPFANRTSHQSADIVGFFVNSLVIRHQFEQQDSLSTLLQRSHDSLLQAYEHNIPFDQLVDLINPVRLSQVNPLFQVMINLQEKANWELSLAELEVNSETLNGSDAKFDLSIDCVLDKGALEMVWEYDTSLFDRATIEHWIQYFELILQQIITDVETPWDCIPLLPNEQRNTLLAAFNDTEYPIEPRCIPTLVSHWAQQTPDKIALQQGEYRLTYQQLELKSTSLANWLLSQGIQLEDRVAIYIDRSIDAILAMLGILKAGAAYVPIHPGFPEDRVTQMLADADPAAVILNQQSPQFDWQSIPTLRLDQLDALQIPPQTLPLVQPHNLAYVLYTSGSTGQPKGVMVEHQQVANLVGNPFYIGLNQGDHVVHCSRLTFDTSAWEIWGSLTQGASLEVVPECILLEPRQFSALLAQCKPNVLIMTYSLFKQHHPYLVEVIPTLKYCIMGGEPVATETTAKILLQHPPKSLVVSYGPTEATVFGALHQARLEDQQYRVSPIGRPLGNTSIYVLDRADNLSPIGVVGEIAIAGRQVGRGYRNLPQLTQQKFIQDPFSQQDQKLYRTGDQARWLADGTLQFLGRNDDQIKIRGIRVEPGEVEFALRQLDYIEDAAVQLLQLEGEPTQLVGYLVCDSSSVNEQLPTRLRKDLTKQIPDYMIPNHWAFLDTLPVNDHGKLDRRALPKINKSVQASSEAVVDRDFATENERQLATCWHALLGDPMPSPSDNFFALGGHSLLAVQLSENLSAAGFSLNVQSIFSASDLGEMASLMVAQKSPDALNPALSTIITDAEELVEILTASQIQLAGGIANIDYACSLSPLQQGLLFHHLVAGSQDPYLLLTKVSIQGETILTQFLQSLEQVIARHDALRTCLVWETAASPLQLILKQAPLGVTYLAPALISESTQFFDQAILKWRESFSLNQAPLLSVLVQPIEDSDSFKLGILAHHIVADQKSLQIAFKEIRDTLDQPDLHSDETTAFAKAAAQRQLPNHRVEAFFRDQLTAFVEPSLPYGLQREFAQLDELQEATQSLSPTLLQSVRTVARKLEVSVAALFHVMWARSLSTLSQQTDVLFGTVLSGRMNLDGNTGSATVGLFINTLPFRLNFALQSVVETILFAHAELIKLAAMESAPLGLAKSCTEVPAELPLFNTLLNYRRELPEQYLVFQELEQHGIQVDSIEEFSHYPFTLNIVESEQTLSLGLQYPNSINGHDVLALCVSTLETMIQAIEFNQSSPFAAMPIVDSVSSQEVIRGFNPQAEFEPESALLHQLFEQQVERSPEAEALAFGDVRLTYSALNGRANEIAHGLLSRGVKPGQLIGLHLTTQLDLVPAILGVLKAGAAYVPLDPSQPMERLRLIVQSASPALIISEPKLAQGGADWSNLVLVSDLCSGQNNNPMVEALQPESLAYVIFTSGSTGTPKGVMVEHRQVGSLLAAAKHYFSFNAKDVWTLFHSFGFDFSVWEIMGALTSGARLVVVPDEKRRAFDELADLLCEEAVTVFNLTPGAMNALFATSLFTGSPHALRYLVLGGDKVDERLVDQWQSMQRESTTQLINMYGITETCVVSSYCDLTQIDCTNDQLGWLGTPLPGNQIYILDEHQNPVPVGVIGEIYVAGSQVTRGYLGQQALTSQRFLTDPFSTQPHRRMYRSGDLAKWHSNGSFEFCGRKDQQIKLRGYRIELGEIEAQLKANSDVVDAVVICKSSQDQKQLLAYWVGSGTEVSLRTALAEKLPGYMLPSAFIQLDKISLTVNGKVDIKALPAPTTSTITHTESLATATEQTLAAIWSELLGSQNLSRRDQFFLIGGDSLLVVRLSHQINQQWDIQIPLRTLFEVPELAKQAAVIDIFIHDDVAEPSQEAFMEEGVLD